MKHIFKKNQIIITALAVMIAVAGYLNYSGTKLGSEVSQTIADKDSVKKETELTETGETGDDSALVDIESLDEDYSDGSLTVEDAAEAENAQAAETDSAQAEGEVSNEAAASDAADAEQVTDTPGEAVLTSIPGSSGFAAEAKLSREQVRAKNKETLLEVINNVNISDEQKQDAINSMTELTKIAEKEAAAELLLESKGFENAVVSITDGTVDVVIAQSEVTDAQRAQIEDIVKRKTEVSGENIVITPMKSTTDGSQDQEQNQE